MTSILDRAEPYYDPYDYDVDANAQAVWKRLRDEAPLYWNDKYEFFALSRFDDVLPAMLDTTTFSSAHMTVLEMMGPEKQSGGMMIFMDPPEHTNLRKLVSRAFTPRAINGLEDRVRRLCAGYLDRYVGAGGFDYVDDFAGLVPPAVILALMGFPEEAADEWRQGIDEMFHMDESEDGIHRRPVTRGDPRRAADDGHGAVRHAARDARGAPARAPGRHDLGARALRPRRARRQHAASSPTARSDRSSRCSRSPAPRPWRGCCRGPRYCWRAIPTSARSSSDEPGVIPSGIEEMLRYEAPSPVNARWVNQDLEYYGQTAAERLEADPAQWQRRSRRAPLREPRRVRRAAQDRPSHRVRVRHALLRRRGAGAPRVALALEETFKRFPTWDIDEDELEWVHTSTVRGFAKVPIHTR